MAFDLGDPVPLTIDITDAAGAPANAGAVVLTVTQPDGTPDVPAVSNPTTGRYQVDYSPTQAGRHLARWVATGANASAYVDAFDVRPADPGYIVSLADAKKHLNKSDTVVSDDEELRRFIGSATRRIERHVGKVIVPRTITERVSASYSNDLWLNYRPILSVTSIATVDGATTWNVGPTYVDIDPDLGRIRVLSGNYWTGNLVVTYVAGMREVPDDYTEAALKIIERGWNSQRQPGLGPNPFTGEEAAPLPTRVTDALLTEMLGPPPPMVA